MTDASFVDTNVWVYGVDTSDPIRQERALEVLNAPWGGRHVVSGQVLGEFFVTVTRKLATPLAPVEAAAMVERMAELAVVPIDGPLVQAAIIGSSEWGISYWDALIIRAAEVAGCRILLTEDLADGVAYGSVTVRNPFAAP